VFDGFAVALGQHHCYQPLLTFGHLEVPGFFVSVMGRLVVTNLSMVVTTNRVFLS